jgi:hypothetical protein
MKRISDKKLPESLVNPYVTTNDVTVNGKLRMTVFVSDGKAEKEEHKIELELKPTAGGQSSNATLTYSHLRCRRKNRSAL